MVVVVLEVVAAGRVTACSLTVVVLVVEGAGSLTTAVHEVSVADAAARSRNGSSFFI
ncbi:MAG: hypothetical protein H0U43_06835 [Chthoniobacterales bacterium]|nr:hypothetical protein [Chthoniobacterales bacterium]